MNTIKKKFAVAHIIGWLLIFLFLCWVFWSEDHANWFYISGIFLLIFVSVFYSHLFILTHYFNRKNFWLYMIGLTIIFMLSPFPFLWLYEVENWDPVPNEYFTFIPFAIFSVVLSSLARATETWFTNALRKETLENQAMRAELSYLKSQINPHFLFNTLNNIHTLAYKNSPVTPEAIMRLSSMMRYMLYESNADMVSLTREIDYLKDFISLQQLRYKQEAIVALEISGNPATCRIAPLLFIHLLENAYKHSPAQLKPGDIKIKIEINERRLVFSIQNPVGNKGLKIIEEPGGIGLANVKKRLQLLYPHQHSFEVNNSDGFFTVILKIDHLQTNEG